MKDVIIIGGGVIGAFVARNLSRYKADVLVIEKENDVGDVTSMANSAIVHSGYDPVPGTKKAYFNVRGNAMFDDVARELDVSMQRVGSLTVALEEGQLKLLHELQERGTQNGVKTVLLSAEEVKAMEPNISPEVKGALLCPTAGIVNPFTLTAHAMENATDNGVQIALGEAVLGIAKKEGYYEIKTSKNTYQAKMVINCAGCYSEEIAKMVEPISWSITPRKGQYYVLDHYAPGLVNHVLFPLPSEKGKGILVTMTTSGNYLVGPSSEFTDSKEDHSTDALTLADVKRQASMMVPHIPFNEQIRTFAGLRSTPSTHDFIIKPSKADPYFIHCAGIESPGLVSSPAIGEYVVEELVQPLMKFEKNPNYNPCIKPYIKMAKLSETERDAFLKEHPDYADIICNCEKISRGEIDDCLSRSLPCLTIKAVKKRTRAGFGKCQGGFCQPKVLLEIARVSGKSPLEVLYDQDGSEILLKESK